MPDRPDQPPEDVFALVTATLAGDVEAMVSVLYDADEVARVVIGALLTLGTALDAVCSAFGQDVADVWRDEMLAREAGR